ncbi:putative short-chain dehydrogenase [Xylariaceae sp. FL1651]|nr:putative short-chain dehydrogenase [Xylariaceae sp. FL1651]
MADESTYKFINKLRGKRVLIFGGTSGIGFAVAAACIEHGCTVIISGSNESSLANSVQRLRASYPHITPSQIITHACDLSSKEDLESNVQKLLAAVTSEAREKLDHVVFTAGDARSLQSVAEVTLAQFDKNQVVRNVAPIIVAKYLPRFLQPGPDSSYTLTGGFIASKPPPGWGLLAASNLEGLTRGLAVDMAPLRVNLVAPGVVKTEAMRNVPEQALDHLAKATTVKRLGRPEDIAEAYVYLMKDGYATGSILNSNGGRFLL